MKENGYAKARVNLLLRLDFLRIVIIIRRRSDTYGDQAGIGKFTVGCTG
jgi:hypothetical protein